MALVTAHRVPASSTMALPHGPAGVGMARRRLRSDLAEYGASEGAVDDAVLIMSELLSNSCRHARPLRPLGEDPRGVPDGGETGEGRIRASWYVDTDGILTMEVTDGGGPTRPAPSSPSLTARGGRGLGIVGRLAQEWGVHDAPGEVTVWAHLRIRARHGRREAFSGGLLSA